MKIIDEDFEPGNEGRCGELNVSMYGTRDVAMNWHEHYAQHLEGLGFKQGKASPCMSSHEEKGFKVFVHGDDYVSSGPEKALTWMAKRVERKV